MPNEPTIPDIYAELASIVCTDINIMIGFRAMPFPHTMQTDDEDDNPLDLRAIIRLNHAPAKVFAIMLKRALKELESRNGSIPLPADFMESIGLAEDEW